ncbi:nuclease domain-containing protein [Paraburkholderia atlantica]|uniref:nuclease domain-containing protein n=1 Tax=Paraburkholderia atlantica TaxID=2654982 RepID=UPI001621D815|nr:nuclease domain-containing protein [Paraburkholderia atlantica]
MKRSGFGPRTTPLKRGSWKSSPVDQKDWRAEVRSGGIKRRVKKPTVAEGSKYLEACRGERCYLSVFGVCLHDPATVVPCHSNQSRHGKGMGIKARHEFTVPGCRACHAFIDQGSATREFKFDVWDRAFAEWEPVRARKMNLELEEA